MRTQKSPYLKAYFLQLRQGMLLKSLLVFLFCLPGWAANQAEEQEVSISHLLQRGWDYVQQSTINASSMIVGLPNPRDSVLYRSLTPPELRALHPMEGFDAYTFGFHEPLEKIDAYRDYLLRPELYQRNLDSRLKADLGPYRTKEGYDSISAYEFTKNQDYALEVLFAASESGRDGDSFFAAGLFFLEKVDRPGFVATNVGGGWDHIFEHIFLNAVSSPDPDALALFISALYKTKDQNLKQFFVLSDHGGNGPTNRKPRTLAVHQPDPFRTLMLVPPPIKKRTNKDPLVTLLEKVKKGYYRAPDFQELIFVINQAVAFHERQIELKENVEFHATRLSRLLLATISYFCSEGHQMVAHRFLKKAEKIPHIQEELEDAVYRSQWEVGNHESKTALKLFMDSYEKGTTLNFFGVEFTVTKSRYQVAGKLQDVLQIQFKSDSSWAVTGLRILATQIRDHSQLPLVVRNPPTDISGALAIFEPTLTGPAESVWVVGFSRTHNCRAKLSNL